MTAPDESGQLGGIEAVAFGLLILVIGTLLVSNAWGVIDAKTAAQEAAREAARAFATAPVTSESSADAIADEAAHESLVEMGWTRTDVTISRIGGAFERCDEVTFEVTVPVPAFRLPWLASGLTFFRAQAEASERVDPYRSGVPLPAGEDPVCLTDLGGGP